MKPNKRCRQDVDLVKNHFFLQNADITDDAVFVESHFCSCCVLFKNYAVLCFTGYIFHNLGCCCFLIMSFTKLGCHFSCFDLILYVFIVLGFVLIFIHLVILIFSY